ncbi:hypothetical protein V6Z11_A07G109700 [Gossypium hirsutum]
MGTGLQVHHLPPVEVIDLLQADANRCYFLVTKKRKKGKQNIYSSTKTMGYLISHVVCCYPYPIWNHTHHAMNLNYQFLCCNTKVNLQGLRKQQLQAYYVRNGYQNVQFNTFISQIRMF